MIFMLMNFFSCIVRFREFISLGTGTRGDQKKILVFPFFTFFNYFFP